MAPRGYYFSVLVLVAGAAAAAAPCYAPTNNFQQCGDCVSEGGELQGTQCVLNGRWFSCKSDLKACCSDGQIRADSLEQCLIDSGDNSLPKDFCKYVVTIDPTNAATNAKCMEICNKIIEDDPSADPREDKSFSDACIYQHYGVKNDRTTVDGQCFNKWVYGYSENSSRPTDAYKTILNVKSPADCQLECQQDEECVNFLWTSDKVTGSHSYDVGLTCRLKNLALVEGAYNTQYKKPDYSDAVDPQVCNVGMGYQCYAGGFTCMKCEGVPRCVWESARHVAGWKYCNGGDSCKIPVETTTTTTTTQPPTEPPTEEPTTTTTEEPTTTTEATTTTEEPTTTTTEEPTTTTEEPTTTTTEEPTTTTEEPTTTTTEEPTTTTTEEPTTTTTEEPTTTTTEEPTTTTTELPTTTAKEYPDIAPPKGQGLVAPYIIA